MNKRALIKVNVVDFSANTIFSQDFLDFASCNLVVTLIVRVKHEFSILPLQFTIINHMFNVGFVEFVVGHSAG
jgi:hypothetical protein